MLTSWINGLLVYDLLPIMGGAGTDESDGGADPEGPKQDQNRERGQGMSGGGPPGMGDSPGTGLGGMGPGPQGGTVGSPSVDSPRGGQEGTSGGGVAAGMPGGIPPASTSAAPSSASDLFTAAANYQDPLMVLANSMGFGTGAGTTGTTGTTGAPATPGGSSILSKMMAAYNQTLPYLLSPNLRATSEGQAVYESAASPIRSKYDTARQQLTDRLGAQQGMSGVLAEELSKLDAEQAQEESNIERGFVGTTTARMTQADKMLSDLLNQEQQRQTSSLGIQAELDQAQRQRLNDLLAAIQPGAQLPAEAATVGQGLLGYAGQLAASENAAQNQGYGSLADLANLIGQGGYTSNTGAPVSLPATGSAYDPMLLKQLGLTAA